MVQRLPDLQLTQSSAIRLILLFCLAVPCTLRHFHRLATFRWFCLFECCPAMNIINGNHPLLMRCVSLVPNLSSIRGCQSPARIWFCQHLLCCASQCMHCETVSSRSSSCSNIIAGSKPASACKTVAEVDWLVTDMWKLSAGEATAPLLTALVLLPEGPGLEAALDRPICGRCFQKVVLQQLGKKLTDNHSSIGSVGWLSQH